MTEEDSDRFIAMKLIVDMKVPAEDQKDVSKALAKILPFFSKDFLNSEKGVEFRDSMLFKQEERAKTIPDCRTAVSTKYRPKEFWKEFDEEEKKMQHVENLEVLPEEWDLKIRPIVASRMFPLPLSPRLVPSSLSNHPARFILANLAQRSLQSRRPPHPT